MTIDNRRRFGGALMAGLLILAAVVSAAAGAVFYGAHQQVYYGTQWAVNVCTTSPLLCGHAEYLAYAAGGSLTLGLGVLVGRAMSGE
uniref:Uncharacterized protein n=1 Tax=Rhodopseudomonas palustris (strain BisA53) TaxID=316055 RepID=Q07ML5_RHOP5